MEGGGMKGGTCGGIGSSSMGKSPGMDDDMGGGGMANTWEGEVVLLLRSRQYSPTFLFERTYCFERWIN